MVSNNVIVFLDEVKGMYSIIWYVFVRLKQQIDSTEQHWVCIQEELYNAKSDNQCRHNDTTTCINFMSVVICWFTVRFKTVNTRKTNK